MPRLTWRKSPRCCLLWPRAGSRAGVRVLIKVKKLVPSYTSRRNESLSWWMSRCERACSIAWMSASVTRSMWFQEGLAGELVGGGGQQARQNGVVVPIGQLRLAGGMGGAVEGG